MVELAKKKGLQVVFQEAYPKGNTDFSALLTKIKAANPDVVAAATYFGGAIPSRLRSASASSTPDCVRPSGKM